MKRPFILSCILHALILLLLVLSGLKWFRSPTPEPSSVSTMQVQTLSESELAPKNQAVKQSSETGSTSAKLTKRMHPLKSEPKSQPFSSGPSNLTKHLDPLKPSKPSQSQSNPSPSHPEPQSSKVKILEKPQKKPTINKSLSQNQASPQNKPLQESPAVPQKRGDPSLKTTVDAKVHEDLKQTQKIQELSAHPNQEQHADVLEQKWEEEFKQDAKDNAQEELHSVSTEELTQYQSLILNALSQHWIVPQDVEPGASCELMIHLGDQGEVLSVDMIRSSGHPDLDRSARNAVLKASPLPLPEKRELFDKFKELRLTVHPEDFQ